MKIHLIYSVFLLVLLNAVPITHSMEQKKVVLVPKTLPAPAKAKPKKSIKELIKEDKKRRKDIYYDAAHLKEIESKGIQKHAPMLILIDQTGEETLEAKSMAITYSLSYGLQQKSYPILVTAQTFKNLLMHLHSPSKNLKIEQLQKFTPGLNNSDWQIFDVPNSQFILLLPQRFVSLFGSNLGIKPLPNISNLLSPDYKSLIDWITQNKKLIPFSKTNFEQTFTSNKDNPQTPIWDVVLMGHGTDNPPIIANLSPQSINELFNFFDTSVKTGLFLLISCKAGGGNRTLLETQRDGVQIKHNFTLILASIGNISAIDTFPTDFEYYTFFFNKAAQIQDKGSSFDRLWEELTERKMSSGDESAHGLQGTPQVWFPGGLGFQTAELSNLVFSVGKVLLKQYQEDHEPMVIIDTKLVLVYPTSIDVPLIVYPTTMETINKKSWEIIPHLFELQFSNNNTETFKKVLSSSLSPEQLKMIEPLMKSIYPQFISMQINNIIAHVFSQIQVESFLYLDKGAAGLGVIQFIRDAFLDVALTDASQVYFIDKLIGNNDISQLLAASRIVRHSDIKHPLEEILKNNTQQEIAVENLMIVINAQGNKFKLIFSIGDSTWEYTSAHALEDSKTHNWWNFRNLAVDRSDYNIQYGELKKKYVEHPETIHQKSISAVLKQKQQKINSKQAHNHRKRHEKKKLIVS